MHEMRSLILAYLNGEISPADFARLQAWIEADPIHGQAYLRMAADERALEKLLVQQDLGEMIDLHFDDQSVQDAASLDLLEQLETQAQPQLIDLTRQIELRQQILDQRNLAAPAEETSEPAVKVIVIPKALVWSGLAAALLALAFVLWPSPHSTPQRDLVKTLQPQQVAPIPQTPPTPSTPPRVATLIGSADAVWSHGQDPLAGTALSPGNYSLRQGRVQLSFASGAVAVIEAPTDFTLDNAKHLRLAHGRIAMRCETPESKGFVIQTPSACITDLGTEFSVEHATTGRTLTQVIEGLVELAPVSENAAGPKSLLTKEQAAVVDPDGGRAQRVAYVPDRQSADWDQLIRRPELEGGARYLFTAPSSLEIGQYEADDSVAVILEKMDHVLADHLLVSFSGTGRQEGYATNSAGRLTAGTAVDCYLLHYDPVNDTDLALRQTVTLRFNRPVLAVITQGRELTRSDRELGLAGVSYAADLISDPGRDARAFDPNYDAITLSDDRCVLTVNVQTSGGMDQLRVLVQPLPVK